MNLFEIENEIMSCVDMETGEIIDVDAYTGGFNLQIAFSTGRLAGLSC